MNLGIVRLQATTVVIVTAFSNDGFVCPNARRVLRAISRHWLFFSITVIGFVRCSVAAVDPRGTWFLSGGLYARDYGHSGSECQ